MGARDFRVSFQFRNETTAVVAPVGSILDANQLNKTRQDKTRLASLPYYRELKTIVELKTWALCRRTVGRRVRCGYLGLN